MKNLHEHQDTHLYDGDFLEFAAESISKNEVILIAAPDPDTVAEIKRAITATVGSDTVTIDTFSGDQTDIPFDADKFDAAIHYNPSRGVLQRHVPLYEIAAVVKPGGTAIYRAPNYIAHSDVVDIEALYALGWQAQEDPTIAGIFTVEIAGDVRNQDDQTQPDQSNTQLAEFA